MTEGAECIRYPSTRLAVAELTVHPVIRWRCQACNRQRTLTGGGRTDGGTSVTSRRLQTHEIRRNCGAGSRSKSLSDSLDL